MKSCVNNNNNKTNFLLTVHYKRIIGNIAFKVDFSCSKKLNVSFWNLKNK